MDNPLRVLIVEDSEDDALLVVRGLKDGGYAPAWERVATADALQAALQEQSWDIVIANYSLPQFGALAALTLVQESGLDLPFIVVSGTIGEDLAVEMMRNGAHDYLMKGNLLRLAPAVERELREAGERHKRRQAEESLQAALREWQATFDAINDGVMLLDRHRTVVRCNRAMAELLGRPSREIIGHACYELMHDTDGPIQSCPMARACGSRQREVAKVEHGDRRFEVTADPVTDENGHLVGVVHAMTDVTERDRVEEALHASEEKYRGVVDNIPVGVAIIGRKMEILGLNREMQRRFPHIDVAKRPLCYRSLYDPPRDSVCSYCPTWKTLQDGQIHEAVAVRGKEADARQYRMLSSPLRDASGNVIAAIEMVEDVTDRKRAEEAMLRASKLDSVALLAGGIAHDFNNVLMGVLGNISIAKAHADANDGIAASLARAEKACHHATQLTHQLLTFAKGGAPVRETAALPELIEDSADFALRGSAVKCKLLIADDLWPAEIDEGQISQAISNLTINAEQAMPDGGTITVRAENVPVGAEEFPALGDGRYVKISIQDEGIGIPADHLSRVFDPYFTTKQKGSGLGLATTHSIVERHDGAIAVESEQGVGTTFHLYLPASGKPASAKRQHEVEAIAGTGRILVMDDEEMVRDVAARMLTHLGYEVECAADGTEAIDMYRQALESEEPFDAVIMDLTVPGAMGGREAVRELLKVDAQAKVIASSGYSTDSLMADREEYGFCAVAPKPYRVDELAQTVHKVLAGSGAPVCTPQ
ncbi:MAG: response regulator [Armatimonadota bacterium]